MEDLKLSKEDFEFVQMDETIHDTKFETKPVGYMKDAWNRFKKNKASVFAAIIILLIVFYGVFYPFTTNRQLSDIRVEYSLMRPKNEFLSNFGICNGQYTRTGTVSSYAQYYGIGTGYLYDKEENNFDQKFNFDQNNDIKFNPVKGIVKVYQADGLQYIDYTVDQYYELGYKYAQLSIEQYEDIIKWEKENGMKILFPLIDTSTITNSFQKENANLWYKADSKGYPLNENGKSIKEIDKLDYLIPNFLKDKEGNVLYYQRVGSAGDSYRVRMLCYTNYIYTYGEEPAFILGSDGLGYDIAIRLAYGIRLSLLLAVCVSIINLVIGSIYGAIEGYYGGTIDIIMERISDILSNVPSMVVLTLFNIFLVQTNRVSPVVSFILAFIVTGWLGTAYRVRTQFYRFKGQEYVLAARTLGAKDSRLMFKHIFPNSLGTIITSSVLVIPGVIFSETSLYYLGIIDLNGPNASSVGTMLSNGQQYLSTYPHVILWPTIIIALLMLSFNLFGNGLRDAFNPSLRGVDD